LKKLQCTVVCSWIIKKLKDPANKVVNFVGVQRQLKKKTKQKMNGRKETKGQKLFWQERFLHYASLGQP